MKNTILLLILSTLWILGCKKDDPIISPPVVIDLPLVVKDSSFLIINGVRWAAELKADYFGNIGEKKMVRVFGKKNITNLNVDEFLTIKDIFPKNGIYQYHCNCDASFIQFIGIPKISLGWVLDLDQAIGTARIDTTQSGSFLEIIRYDSVQHIVEGRFEAYLNVTDRAPNPYYELENHITQGYFLLNIKQ